MDGTRDSHTKYRKSDRERQVPCDITYIWNLIYGTNKPFHRKENHGHGEETCGCQGMDWELGVNRCKLLPFGVDKQWDPAVYHRELNLVSYDGIW